MDNARQAGSKEHYILREAYREFRASACSGPSGRTVPSFSGSPAGPSLAMCHSPLVHIDTHFKIPEMIEYRDRMAREWKLNMVYGRKRNCPEQQGNVPGRESRPVSHAAANLKSEGTQTHALGEWTRYRMNHALGRYVTDPNKEPYTGVIVGARADEEGSRSKERYFSSRDKENEWDVGDQPSGIMEPV